MQHAQVSQHDKKRSDEILRQAGIDVDLSRWVLSRVRQMDSSGQSAGKLKIEGFPQIESGPLQPPEKGGYRITDLRDADAMQLDISAAQLSAALDRLPEEIRARLSSMLTEEIGDFSEGSNVTLNARSLETIGLAALPLVSYGILNGGSATSYADEKKNRGFNDELFQLYRAEFDRQSSQCSGKAKGITAAYLNPDGSPGHSFIELKIRRAMLLALKHDELFPESRALSESSTEKQSWPRPLFPLFQMTSSGNNEEIAAAYKTYLTSPLLKPLAEKLGLTGDWFVTGVQPLIAAMQHSSEISEGRQRDFFLNAYGEKERALALPGGHGQNFFALEGCYRGLYASGKLLAYLGNVDNMGFLPDPIEIALLLLFNSPAGFDFSFKTAVDVKGGVLLKTAGDRLTCGDIGPAVSASEIEAAQSIGKPILFNCASGLFRLDYLCAELNDIQRDLPLRLSDQDKDAGRYSQAEQVTWEVMELLKGFTVFGVDKYRRFLASKMLLENFMTSGLKLDDADFPAELKSTAQSLHSGFLTMMREIYAMELKDGCWQPVYF